MIYKNNIIIELYAEDHMHKKSIMTALGVFLLLTLCSCAKNKINTEDTIDFLKNIRSYTCFVEMKVLNNKQNIVYSGREIYSKKYGYRFEIGNERVLLYLGDKIYVRDLINDSQYVTDKDFDSLYRLSFIGEYIDLLYTDEEIKSTLNSLGGKQFQIIELTIPGTNRNLSTAELYIDINDDLPQKLIIYDADKKKKVEVIYKGFTVNPEIDKKQFDTIFKYLKNTFR